MYMYRYAKSSVSIARIRYWNIKSKEYSERHLIGKMRQKRHKCIFLIDYSLSPGRLLGWCETEMLYWIEERWQIFYHPKIPALRMIDFDNDGLCNEIDELYPVCYT